MRSEGPGKVHSITKQKGSAGPCIPPAFLLVALKYGVISQSRDVVGRSLASQGRASLCGRVVVMGWGDGGEVGWSQRQDELKLRHNSLMTSMEL